MGKIRVLPRNHPKRKAGIWLLTTSRQWINSRTKLRLRENIVLTFVLRSRESQMTQHHILVPQAQGLLVHRRADIRTCCRQP